MKADGKVLKAFMKSTTFNLLLWRIFRYVFFAFYELKTMSDEIFIIATNSSMSS